MPLRVMTVVLPAETVSDSAIVTGTELIVGVGVEVGSASLAVARPDERSRVRL